MILRNRYFSFLLTPRNKRNFFPAYLYSGLLWIAASLPGEELEKIQKYPDHFLLRFLLSDAFLHFLVFGLLTLLICRGYSREMKTVPWFWVGFIASGYGFLIEVYQGILPWRSFGLDDLIWNTIGVAVFLSLIRLLPALKPT